MTYRIDACVKLVGSLVVEADSEREALEQAQEIASERSTDEILLPTWAR